MQILFLGTSAFAVPTLERLHESGHRVLSVITQPDRPKGRSLPVTTPPVKQAADRMQIPVLQPTTFRDEKLIGQIRSLKAECAVVVSYGLIFPKAFLTLFPKGAINLHASLLPKYRGAAPIQWAILKGEQETGVTIFQIDEQLDHGPVLLQEKHPIGPDDTTAILLEKLAAAGSRLVLATLEGIDSGKAKPIPQDHTQATQAPQLKKADGRIHWKEDCTSIHNRVRAFQPWPGTLTTQDEKPLKIISTHPDPNRQIPAPPGTVVTAEPAQGFWVQTGHGQLRIDRCQPAGGKVMAAADFLRGHRLQPGELLI